MNTTSMTNTLAHANEELIQAAADNDLLMAMRLIGNGSDLNTRDAKFGMTPLMHAAYYGNEDMVKLLIIAGANIDATDITGRTVLSFVSHWVRPSIVKLLIESGANLDIADNEGKTPLIWAVFGKHELIVKTLVDGGANLLAVSNDGKIAIDIAINFGLHSIVDLLRN